MSNWYREGTISLVNGSTTVTGTGTSWLENVAESNGLKTPIGPEEIESVTSNTELQLVMPYTGPTISGVAYSIIPTQGVAVSLVKKVVALLSISGVVKDAFANGQLAKTIDLDKRVTLVQLAAAAGVELVGYDGGSLQDIADNAKTLQNYTALRAYTGRAKNVRITSVGVAGIFELDAGDTSSPDNGGTVIVDASARRWKRNYSGSVLVKWFGAMCDGISRPLSTLFTTLPLAQARYPSAAALTDELDSVAIQQCFDVMPAGTTVECRGVIRSNRAIYINKSGVVFDTRGATMKISGSPKFSLVVHGGTMNRNLANPAWALQLLEMTYEATTPVKGVKVLGLTVESASGGRTQTQAVFLFADDCEVEMTVRNSDGNGVEFRNCVNPRFSSLTFEDIASYGLFGYQNHGLQGGTLKATRCGQPYSIKQRHKSYLSNSARIDRVIGVDCTGLAGTAWCTGGYSFQELVREGLSAAVVAARNFPGHEICRDVTIGRHDLMVTSAAGPLVTTPSVSIGAFADAWKFGEINLDAGGKDTAIIPLQIGVAGDIADGLAGGATFGQNHRVTNVNFANFAATSGNPLIGYAVSASVIGGTYKNCTIFRLLNQAEPNVLPFGQVDSFEFRDQVGAFTIFMGAAGDRGVRVLADTKRFISGGNRLTFTPANFNAETVCNPWYVRAPMWQTIGRDDITVVSGGSAASNHTTTFCAYTTALAGNINVKTTGTAPTTLRGLGLAGAASTKALVLEPSEFVMTGAPTGEKSAIVVSGEVSMMGGNTFSGGWSTTLSDISGGKNAQNLRRTVWLTAPPTTGTWATGDRVINIAPFAGQPKGWTCTASGTPGTWASDGNL